MPDPLQQLFKAIIEDERARANALLQADARLATRTLHGDGWYEPRIVHWLYAGDTALHAASAGYRLECAKGLLDAGAEPNAAENHRRSGPLHYAADGHLESPAWNETRQVAMIRLLLKAGADIHAQDKNGATPLHRAVRTRCAAAVKCLLQAGADATMRNLPGSTPFHLAVQNTGRGGSGADAAKTAQRQIIGTFLEHGTSAKLKDASGKSVLDWARSGWVREALTQ